jgi:hypothetical protein
MTPLPDRVVLHPWKRCKEFLNLPLWVSGYWGPPLVPYHLGQYPIQRLPVRILGALKKATWLRSDRQVTPFTSMRLSGSPPCLLDLESRGACTRGANLFRLQCDFNPRMAEGTFRSVSSLPLFDSSVGSADRLVQALEHCVMPVGLCTQSLYVKRTCQPNRGTLSIAIFIDDPRLKNGNEMRLVAQRTRMRTMAHQPTRPGMHLAAMRMSLLRKSFGWRTSMGAVVANATSPCSYPPTFYVRLISDKHIHFAQFPR